MYEGNNAEIDTKDMERISQVQEKVKIAFPHISAGYPQIQFCDKENNQIDDFDDIPEEYYSKRKDGGLALDIKLLPSLPSSSMPQVSSSKKQKTYKGMSVEASCRKYLDAVASNLHDFTISRKFIQKPPLRTYSQQ